MRRNRNVEVFELPDVDGRDLGKIPERELLAAVVTNAINESLGIVAGGGTYKHKKPGKTHRTKRKEEAAEWLFLHYVSIPEIEFKNPTKWSYVWICLQLGYTESHIKTAHRNLKKLRAEYEPERYRINILEKYLCNPILNNFDE